MQGREIWSALPRGQQPALCFSPVHQAALHLTLGLPQGPWAEHVRPQPPEEGPVTVLQTPIPSLPAGPPMMGTRVLSPWAEPPASTMRDPRPVPPPRPECLDAPRSHTTWFPHTGLWAIQGMPFVDMQNFYEYSFL